MSTAADIVANIFATVATQADRNREAASNFG
jgi:hypothetical protein